MEWLPCVKHFSGHSGIGKEQSSQNLLLCTQKVGPSSRNCCHFLIAKNMPGIIFQSMFSHFCHLETYFYSCFMKGERAQNSQLTHWSWQSFQLGKLRFQAEQPWLCVRGEKCGDHLTPSGAEGDKLFWSPRLRTGRQAKNEREQEIILGTCYPETDFHNAWSQIGMRFVVILFMIANFKHKKTK